MAYTVRYYDCADCGTWTVRKRKTRDPRICIDCGVTRLTTNSLLMRAKTGKGYAKWLESRGPNGRPRKQQEG